RSHEDHRDRRDRETTPHHAWLAYDFQHRERRREVLRDYPGHFRQHPAEPGRVEYYEAAKPAKRHPLGGHLQRDHHYFADPAGFAGSGLPAAIGVEHFETKHLHLWHRRAHHSLRRDQADRYPRFVVETGLMETEVLL